jgi:hypothetical protein
MKELSRVTAAILVGLLFISPVFAQEAASPAAPSPAAVAPAQAEEPKVWLDDVLPLNAKTEGTWNWEAIAGASGKVHSHPSAKGLQSHGFMADTVKLTVNEMLTQQVWLDPQDPPQGIMLSFKLADGKEVGVYWEGEEEVFTPGEDEEVWYYGLLPELGTWTPLEVLIEDLGLEEQDVAGVSFITFDGRALWDKLSIEQAPPLEELEEFPAEEEIPPTAPPTQK